MMTLIVALCTASAFAASTGSGTLAANEVIGLERQALDRWGNGDPTGFLETYAQEITYFDIAVERRIDGHGAMAAYYAPLVGKIKVARYDMIAPKVQHHGNVAVLTYNLISEAVQPNGIKKPIRWNSTAVYAHDGDTWKMIHSHWSLTAPPSLRGIN